MKAAGLPRVWRARPPAASTGSRLIARGRALFESSCAACHGSGLRGIPGRGPSAAGRGRARGRLLPADGPDAAAFEPRRSRCARARLSRSATSARSSPTSARSAGRRCRRSRPTPARWRTGSGCSRPTAPGCHTIQGQGGIVTGATVAVAEQRVAAAGRRGDQDRAVRDAALRPGRAVRRPDRLDRALRPVACSTRKIGAAGASAASGRSRRAWSRGCSRPPRCF